MMWKSVLQQLTRDHLLRELSVIDSTCGPIMSLNGQDILLFASNDYLGLANHPHLKLAACKAIDQFGVGAGASRLVSGTLRPHHELELALAQFFQEDAALALSSGYATNIGIIPNLITPEGLILADRLCHASLIDGCRLSRASLRVFDHNDMDHLKVLLAKRPRNRPTLIVTEGVFSMDGDLAPLAELAHLAKEYDATLLIDDAHGTGVMGPTGRGTLEHFGVKSANIIHMGTLSKALGTSGGFITGTNDFIDYAINTARSFIYSTAPPPAIAAAAHAALGVILQEPERRTRLWRNREYMYQGLRGMGCHLTNTESPILPIIVNHPELAMKMSLELRQKGLFIPAIRPPTVPKGTSRLRITVTAEHSTAQIDSSLAAIQHVGQSLRLL
ncbi:MAG: 8-amino-7-oxononanoate synthase [Nitrospirota bacterium]|nr:8-amino-7-oxononanoate synthase [Nitrospirota bacterium]MDH5586515.1 8-amino-7-oxononanoate synthase [Nitrospirota bacterium]MDH5774602.1 8-amino-7-oxononanoate synthase [Nitrospirota bacterium]